MKLTFCKYHGAGNDFIIIDNRSGEYTLDNRQIALVCHRRFGIGADGLMLLEPAEAPYGFAMHFYNSDGYEGTMCGNGGRCISAFADRLGIDNLLFTAVDGPHKAIVLDRKDNVSIIKLQIRDVPEIKTYDTDSYIVNTGSLHLVKFVKDVQNTDVFGEGKYWRSHKDFGTHGINVNFVEILDNGCLFVRTFERGVEDETWACGTGSTASAIAAGIYTGNGLTHWDIQTKGGNLQVDYEPHNGTFRNVMLSGPAAFIFRGEAEI